MVFLLFYLCGPAVCFAIFLWDGLHERYFTKNMTKTKWLDGSENATIKTYLPEARALPDRREMHTKGQRETLPL